MEIRDETYTVVEYAIAAGEAAVGDARRFIEELEDSTVLPLVDATGLVVVELALT